jgi:hypothetical protein
MLYSVDSWLVTNVSRQSIVEAVQVCLTLDGGTEGCPETSVTNYRLKLRNISEERKSQENYCYLEP